MARTRRKPAPGGVVTRSKSVPRTVNATTLTVVAPGSVPTTTTTLSAAATAQEAAMRTSTMDGDVNEERNMHSGVLVSAIQQLMSTVGRLKQRLGDMENERDAREPRLDVEANGAGSTDKASTPAALPTRTTTQAEPTSAPATTAAALRGGTHKKSAKDLELTPFKSSPTGVRVETRISKVVLAVEGARILRRGEWTDEELYYIVGNKLQDDAAKVWVQMNKKLIGAERTWSKLKAAMVRRCGERPDLAAAELREPENLEKAVDKATKIDDPIYNVARGMRNIWQAWAVSTHPGVVQMDGTTGLVTVVPGLEDESDMVSASPSAEGGRERDKLAYFTYPQVVFNKNTRFWAVPRDRVWNGRYWAPTKKEKTRPLTTHDSRTPDRRLSGKSERKAKVLLAVAKGSSSSSEESDVSITPSKGKKRRAPSICNEETKSGTAAVAQRNGAAVCGSKRPRDESEREDGTDQDRGCESVVHRPESAEESNEKAMKLTGASTTPMTAVLEAQMQPEMEHRDKGRDERYVATVRPAMAALRYVHTGSKEELPDGPCRMTEEGGKRADTGVGGETEEGEGPLGAGVVAGTGEGGGLDGADEEANHEKCVTATMGEGNSAVEKRRWSVTRLARKPARTP
ncbi:unnamed protein product [Phytophthora fragariaefolia]|uniref:Unnamed protein product n=1 Tax=Phytophthora fragariaefolia TaxID=1490495 RepID=A0A9W6UCN7_9STRA|nr:unnamed protein product [Phytophthora fragariaefolia]